MLLSAIVDSTRVFAFLVALAAELLSFTHVGFDDSLAHAFFREDLDGVSTHFLVFVPELLSIVSLLFGDILLDSRAVYRTPETGS